MGFASLALIAATLLGAFAVRAQRSFTIDYANNQFLRDGKPYRYISGEVHYFRTHPDQWNARLSNVRAAGLNAVTTYIPWNFHETFQGQFNFSGWRDFTKFFDLAKANELAVIIRPGPYICAEWENGGLPYWLLKYPNINLRTSQTDFLTAALNWWDALLPKVVPYLWKNGGPVIMAQIENEYGSYGCDTKYKEALRDKAVQHFGNDVVLFTTDPPEVITCGVIDGVYATVDFGQRGLVLMDEYFAIQKSHNTKGGPRVNSEYYPGWYLTWGGNLLPNQNVSPASVREMTQELYAHNASFNFYMFHGGTNFEFWNGAEYDGGLITSYDYFAPMDEAGTPTDKYVQVANVIKTIPHWENQPKPTPKAAPTINFPGIGLKRQGNLLDYLRNGQLTDKVINNTTVMTFEQLDRPFGFIMYETTLTADQVAAMKNNFLDGQNIRDFGYVFLNDQFKFTFSPHFKPKKVQVEHLDVKAGDTLKVLVENQGRLTWVTANDPKGILQAPTIGGVRLDKWTIRTVNLDAISNGTAPTSTPGSSFMQGDVFYGEVNLGTRVADTWLDLTNWGKGVVYINGFNIGRYWSTFGPQKALYIPAPMLTTGTNRIAVLELEKRSSDCSELNTFCSVNLINHPLPL